MKRLAVKPENCTGCTGCALECSVSHTGTFCYSAARIHVERDEEHADFRPRVCVQCGEAPCIAACPSEALSRHPLLRTVSVEAERCVGCRECAKACPHGGIAFGDEGQEPLICDLCGGNPSCVDACRFAGAIAVVEEAEA